MENSLKEIYNSVVIIYKSILNDKQLLFITFICIVIYLVLTYYLYYKYIKPYISFGGPYRSLYRSFETLLELYIEP